MAIKWRKRITSLACPECGEIGSMRPIVYEPVASTRPGSSLTWFQGPWIHWGHSLMSEAALKSEHGVNNYLGNPLGDVQVRIDAFFVFKEAAS